MISYTASPFLEGKRIRNLGSLMREKDDRLQKEALEKQQAEQKAAVERIKKEEIERRKRIESEEKRKEKTKRDRVKKTIMIFAILIIAGIFITIQIISSLDKKNQYEYANQLIVEKKYNDAISVFTELQNYKDSEDKILEVYYLQGKECVEKNDLITARSFFEKADGYGDSETYIYESYYREGISYVENENYEKAIESFGKCENYRDSKSYLSYCALKLVPFDKKSDISTISFYLQNITVESLKQELMTDYPYKILSIINGCWESGGIGSKTVLIINGAKVTERIFKSSRLEKTMSYQLVYEDKKFCYGNIPEDYWCIMTTENKKINFYHFSYWSIDYHSMKDEREFTPVGSWQSDDLCK